MTDNFQKQAAVLNTLNAARAQVAKGFYAFACYRRKSDGVILRTLRQAQDAAALDDVDVNTEGALRLAAGTTDIIALRPVFDAVRAVAIGFPENPRYDATQSVALSMFDRAIAHQTLTAFRAFCEARDIPRKPGETPEAALNWIVDRAVWLGDFCARWEAASNPDVDQDLAELTAEYDAMLNATRLPEMSADELQDVLAGWAHEVARLCADKRALDRMVMRPR